MTVTIELTIRRLPDASLVAELRAELPRNPAHLGSAPVVISAEALRNLALLPDAYGAALTAMAIPATLHTAWERARGYAERGGDGLHVGVAIDDPSGELHGLRWELLRDPRTNESLAQQEGGSLARLVVVEQLHDAPLPAKPALRALIAVAGPSDSERWGLAPIDVASEAALAVAALGEIKADVPAGETLTLATLANIRNGLRSGAHILYLVCHGKATAQGSTLYLVGDDGTAAPIGGEQLAAEISALDAVHRPLLAVLVACESAEQDAAPLASIGPMLARAGIPAVMAMQAKISMDAAAQLTGRLLRELGRDGRIDRALAAARREMGTEWWVPVLWLRTRDGRLWKGEDERTIARRQRLELARSRHSQERFAELRQGFVGRQAELAAIRAEVDALRGTGGYLLVTGVAGQGKSCVLAALIAECGIDATPTYFIRFSPGADEQVALLRHLVAHLLTQYDLEELADSYLPETAGMITLANSLTMVLDRISGAGQQVTLVIDGLDQIRPDRQMGERDLSFLPEKLPAGIVIIIGTRPDDTLKPLKVLASQREYRLPPLSAADFAALLDQRGAALAIHDRQALYDTLHGNAFDLAFVVREITATRADDVSTLLERVRKNPQDIFTPALDRLKGDKDVWKQVIRPLLGCLLAATGSEPLSEDALGAILGLDTDEVSDALLQLRGFLGEIDRGGRAFYYLYHLKLIDYLRGAQATAGTRIFSTRDIEQYHKNIATWCASGGRDVIWQDVPGNALGQERRAYARQHYIVHLAAARSYEQLWSVIDTGEYGVAKRRHDPSTRSYALDLDITRQAAIEAAVGDTDAQARALPRLWKYSLLRCSLASQADHYPEELFLALVAMGREDEAINLAELLSDPTKKTNTLRGIGAALLTRNSADGISVFQRACATTEAIPDTRRRAEALRSLAEALAHAQHPAAPATFAVARATAEAIPDKGMRAQALSRLAEALAQAKYREEAITIFAVARATAEAIPDDMFGRRAEALSCLVEALAQAQLWEEARATAEVIPDDVFGRRARALSSLAEALAHAQHPAAPATFAIACTTAEVIPDIRRRAEVLSHLAEVLAQAQYWEEARATAEAIPNAGRRAEVLSRLAEALAQVQHPAALTTFAVARATAEAIPDARIRAEALSCLAEALAQAQYWEEARTTFTVARTTMETIPDDVFGSRTEALSCLAEALAQAQYWEEARATAEAIPDAGRRAEVLSRLAEALAQAQHWEEARTTLAVARATAETIPDDMFGMRAEVLSRLAEALAQAQHWEEARATFAVARATAEAIPDDVFGRRSGALNHLAKALTQAQYWEEARATAEAIPDAGRRAEALRSLDKALAQAQYWEEARATAEAIPDTRRRAAVLRSLAVVLAQAQHPAAPTTFAVARATAEAIPNAEKRAWSLSHLVEALAQVQYWEEARATAEAIPDTRRRAAALRNLSETLAQVQRWEEARVTAEAIPDTRRRAAALNCLAIDLAQTNLIPQSVTLLTDLWRRAQTRDELLRLFAITPELLRAYPGLGKEFLDSFAWVDAQLVVS